MKRFIKKKNNLKITKLKLIGASVVLMLLSVLTFSHAHFEIEDNFKFVDSSVEAPISLNVYVNDEKQSGFPNKDNGIGYFNLLCDDGISGLWDDVNWSLVLEHNAYGNCDIHFREFYKETLLNDADPVLNSGFIPVIIDEDGTVKKANLFEKWYSYENKEWANAVTVNSLVYRDALAGTIIPMDNIEEMYVWIPRYSYDAETIVDADHAIDITFVNKNTGAHPAFTVGETELNGLWVGKFEMGFKDGEDELSSDLKYVIKPDVNSVHDTNISTMFTMISNINNTNNLDEDSDVHMIKNTEWGAIAYLSQSIYGVCNSSDDCSKVENNNYFNSSTYDIVTGCGGSDIGVSTDSSGIDICPESNRWTTVNGMSASTTNNITGIYDMAGGRWEHVMGNMLNTSGLFNSGTSGFISAPSLKYYDVYLYGSDKFDYTRGLVGDAILELNLSTSSNSNWNSDYADFVNSSTPWFYRGGHANGRVGSGIWSFSVVSGFANSVRSTRAVVWSY